MTTVSRVPAANPPIVNCPHCYPPRPMVIKTVSCAMLEVEKIVFACSECSASLELPHPPPSREAA
jgi:hypothetical protein